ncbi:MAG TPA: hypothetical protein VHU81_10985, partial [Thermoanaerobaculia bacterium]|nr:hypothetical protein [Thermoanaerobaculia bacterium]
WVFVAKVTVRKAGFHRNIPGILLQIHPEETIKGPADRSSAHFIFMPIGVFEIGTTGICKTHPSYANLPEIGDEVLLFIDLESTWREQGEFLWTDEETGIVTIHGSKEVSFPRNFLTNGKSTKPATREELLRRVQEELRGSR